MKTTLSSTAEFFAGSAPATAPVFPLWMLPHYLGLDAVTVAVVWQIAAARHLHAHIPWIETLALALAVFCIYLGDRLRDSFFMDARARPRHVFVRKHRPLLLTVFFTALIAGALVAVFWIHTSLLFFGLTLIPIVLLYFAWTHLRGVFTQVGCLKECTVGLVFSAGVFLAPALHTDSLDFETVVAALAFASLCALNCLAIAHYETSPRNTQRPTLPPPALLLTAAFPIFFCLAQPQHPWFFSAALLGTVLLCSLILLRRAIHARALPFAADVALIVAGLAAWIL